MYINREKKKSQKKYIYMCVYVCMLLGELLWINYYYSNNTRLNSAAHSALVQF